MQIKRRTFLLGAAATLAMKKNGAAQVAASSDNTQLVTWSRVVTNGGGLINGLSIASDGTKTCRTDTGGWYVWDGVNSIWVQSATVAKTGSPPYEFSGYRGLAGIPECQVAPSNGNYIYWFFNDIFANNRYGSATICLSTNKGLRSKATNYPTNNALDAHKELILGGANDTYKRVQNKIGIDPTNERVVYATNPGSRPLVTSDAGLTWTDVPDLPVGTGIGACCWTFDRGGEVATVNGKTVTKNIYCAVAGSGTWASTDGGVSFAQISSMIGAAAPGFCSVSSDGVFYLADVQRGVSMLNRYKAGSWSVILTGDPGAGRTNISVAAHPTAAGVVCAMRSANSAHHYYYSSSYGESFTNSTKMNETWLSSDAPWLANQMSNFTMGNTTIIFDPASQNDLYAAIGQGIWKTTISGAGAPTWHTITTGIEQTVTSDVVHESGTPLFHVVNDLSCFQHPTTVSGLSTAPSNPIWGPLLLTQGWSGAIDPYQTQNVVIADGTPTYCGYSRDGGKTFTRFATTPPIVGTYGQIMIANGVIMWCFSDAHQGYWYRSANWGASWTKLDNIANIPKTEWTGWAPSTNAPKHTGCFDRVNPNKIYLYNWFYGNSPVIKGMFLSTDAGQTFSYQGISSDPFPRNSAGFLEIRAVPGIEGYLFAAVGYNSGTAHPRMESLYKSTDGGAHWASVPNTFEPNYFGFGKAGASGLPTLYLAGFRNSVYGIYMSQDLGVTWSQLKSASYGPWPLTNDAVSCVEGDKDVFGRCYVGFRGTGAAYSTIA